MAEDAPKPEPGFHVRQAKGHTQPNYRVQRRDGVQNHRRAREDRPTRRENNGCGFFHRRDWHVRVRPEAGHDQERRFGIPPLRQDIIPEHPETVNYTDSGDVLPLGVETF